MKSAKVNENESQKYSKTMEELVEMLKSHVEKNGPGGYLKFDSKDFKEGYDRAISDILWTIMR